MFKIAIALICLIIFLAALWIIAACYLFLKESRDEGKKESTRLKVPCDNDIYFNCGDD